MNTCVSDKSSVYLSKDSSGTVGKLTTSNSFYSLDKNAKYSYLVT